jgi:hypothetical protein
MLSEAKHLGVTDLSGSATPRPFASLRVTPFRGGECERPTTAVPHVSRASERRSESSKSVDSVDW